MSSSVLLDTRFKLHQTVYDRQLKVQLAELGVAIGSWLWEAVQHEAERSKIRRLAAAEIQPVVDVLRAMAGNVRWRRLALKSFDELSMADIVSMFELLEGHVAATSLSGNVKHSFSLRTRALLLRYLRARGFPKIERISAFFKSKLPLDRNQHRELIADEANADAAAPLEPLGALSHVNIPELKRKMQERIASPLRRIVAACKLELERYEAAHEAVLTLIHEPYDKRVVAALTSYHLGSLAGTEVRDLVSSLNGHAAAHAYIQLFFGDRPLDQPFKVKTLLLQQQVEEYLKERLQDRYIKGVLRAPIWAVMRPLLMCLIIIQRHTMWNSNSVLEMTLDGISSTVPPLQLSSLKTRTNRPTPAVFVERSNEEVVLALTFLTRRLSALKRTGWVAQDENRLWLNAPLNNNSPLRPFVGWGTDLKTFIRKAGLPDFSLEQIRTTALSLESLGSGGAEAARRRAGHRSLSTTSIYIDQLLLQRFNTSVNFEFTRRIEREILDGTSSPYAPMLFPIGDGTSCSDPTAPPFDDYLFRGLCDAKRCHAGNGCPNNKLRVDSDAIEAALRLQIYYRSNWARLCASNPEAFTAYHLPSILFNGALIAVLEQGLYSSSVREIRRTLKSEFND